MDTDVTPGQDLESEAEAGGDGLDPSSEDLDADGFYKLPHTEIRRRSLAGIFYITSSSVANLLIGFFASLALARLLTPKDFGVVAVGSTVTLLAGVLADGGLGAGMIRRQEPPTRAELRTINGIQLVLTSAICLPGMAVALAFGRTGAVTALMILSLPIAVLQTPGRIVLLREMRYDRQLAIDLGSQVGFQVFSVVAVVLGAGVWGLAAGSVVKAALATIVTAWLTIGFARPSLAGWRKFGGLIKFGLSFQANWFAVVLREQCINIVIAALAGVGTLGIWTFTDRIFQFPQLAFSSLYAVGFPAMSNLLISGADVRPVIMRTVRRASIVGAFVFAAFAAASPELIPAVFGSQWRSAAEIVPFICLSTLVLGAISVAADSYLAAHGKPGVVAWSSAALGVGWLAVTAPLLPLIGAAAVGVGNLVGALLEAAILNWATYKSAGVSPYRPLVRPTLVAVLAGAAGWTFCTRGMHGLWVGLAAGALTTAICFGGLLLLCREDLLDTINLAREAVSTVTLRLRPKYGTAEDEAPVIERAVA